VLGLVLVGEVMVEDETMGMLHRGPSPKALLLAELALVMRVVLVLPSERSFLSRHYSVLAKSIAI
jgi:hypothetical protein